MDSKEYLGALLKIVWEDQEQYNARVKREVIRNDHEWATNYAAGLVSEIGELLRELNWSASSQYQTPTDGTAIALELADLTKYTFCLWQLFGWKVEDVLQWLLLKGETLNFKQREIDLGDIVDQLVLITDLDGTVADWRTGFLDWLTETGKIQLTGQDKLVDSLVSLEMDVDFGWSYGQYQHWKKQFEHSGGYARLPVFPEVQTAFAEWAKWHPFTIAVTARPISISRVYFDTYFWLQRQNIPAQRIHMVSAERVGLALQLKEQGNTVIMLEDDPSIIRRSSMNGITTIVREAPYNSAEAHLPNVYRVQELGAITPILEELLKGGTDGAG